MADSGPGAFEGYSSGAIPHAAEALDVEGPEKLHNPYTVHAYQRPKPQADLARWFHFIVKHRKGRDNLAHINRVIGSSSGTDKCLMLAGYTLMALTTALERVNGPATPEGPAFPSVKSFESRMKNLSTLISDFRIFSRLFGLFGIAEWACQTYEAPPKDSHLRRIAYSQVMVNVAYQMLENVAYLSQHKILKYSVAAQNKMWAWSCRFWAAHVVLDFARLWRVRVLRQRYKGVTDAEDHEWWRQVSSNLCWAPLTVHWSVENGGVLDGFTTGCLGMAAGIMSVQHVWRQTA